MVIEWCVFVYVWFVFGLIVGLLLLDYMLW